MYDYCARLEVGATNGWGLIVKGDVDCSSTPHLFCSHPHGLFCAGVSLNLILSKRALTAVRAFMPSPAEGAVGSLDYTKEERRKLAERSRREVPEFGASPERRELVRRVHAAMMRKWEVSQVSLRKGQNNFSEKNAEDAEEKESDEVSDDASVADGDGSAAAASDATTERLAETSAVVTNAIETNASDVATLGSEADALSARRATLRPSAAASVPRRSPASKTRASWLGSAAAEATGAHSVAK